MRQFTKGYTAAAFGFNSNVRFGSLADIAASNLDVRFVPIAAMATRTPLHLRASPTQGIVHLLSPIRL
jgi:hypothetical protein